MNWRRLIPNSISSASLIFGVLSIFKTIEGDFFLAPVFIVIAVIFDSMDGRAARALGVGGGDFGKEMDSLCDMCSFGVAPAIMIYMYGLQELGLAGQVIAALFAVGGCLRLARFNIDTRQTTSFIGLPIPSEAIFWIGFTAWCIEGGMPVNWLTALIVLAMSLLMVSNIGMFSLKFKNFHLAENINRYVILAAAVALVLWLGIPGLMWTILLYLVLSMINIRVSYTESGD